jgi:hypothetical protein
VISPENKIHVKEANKMANWTLGISIVALLISGISLYYSYEQIKILKETNYLQIEPDISCYLDYPKNENPTVVIKNNAPVKIVSIGVKHKLFEYNKNNDKISLAASMGNIVDDFGGDYMLFKPELGPKEFIMSQLAKISWDGNQSQFVIIYLFEIDYFRESDMKYFNKKEIFFIDGGKVYRHQIFVNNPNYRKIMAKINSYSFPEAITSYPPAQIIADISKNNT